MNYIMRKLFFGVGLLFTMSNILSMDQHQNPNPVSHVVIDIRAIQEASDQIDQLIGQLPNAQELPQDAERLASVFARRASGARKNQTALLLKSAGALAGVGFIALLAYKYLKQPKAATIIR